MIIKGIFKESPLGPKRKYYHLNIFGKRIGFPLGLFFLLSLINAIGMSIILGWAYAKTENVWCWVCIHGLNNGGAGGTDSMTEVPFFTILLRFVVMFLFLFTKEYRKDKKKSTMISVFFKKRRSRFNGSEGREKFI